MAVTVVQQTNSFDQWRVKTNTISSNLGDAATLTTVADDAVSAINELDADIGSPASLTTTAKNNVVAAVNELDADLGNPATLTTTAKNNVVSAVNELDSQVGDLNNLSGGETNLVDAVNNNRSAGTNFSIAMAIALG